MTRDEHRKIALAAIDAATEQLEIVNEAIKSQAVSATVASLSMEIAHVTLGIGAIHAELAKTAPL